MMKHYPKKIKKWVLTTHALQSNELTPMTGIEAIELGVKSCNNEE